MQFVARSANPTRPSPVGAIFFALTGTLIATSIVNVGSSGIPFFYLAFLLPIVSVAFPVRWYVRRRLDSQSLRALISTGAVALGIVGTTLLHLITIKLGNPRSEVVHLVSRLCFLVYFSIALIWVREGVASKTIIWLRRLLIVACLYGVYQLAAIALGLPLFLDWLRNNLSFFNYGYDTAGWIAIARATSIYAEPSQATIPILVLFMLNIRVKTSPVWSFIGWLSLLMFTVATFSRSAWIGLFVAAGVSVLFRSAALCRLIQNKRLALAVITLSFLVLMPVWGFVLANDGTEGDLSAQERSGGIVLGVHMIKDAPILGSGWNSFGDMVPRYSHVSLDVDPSLNFGIVHNTVVSYVQQAGLSGLALASLPFVLVAVWSTAPAWMTCSTLASFLIATESGDIGYSSLTWLWVALLVNMGAADAQPPVTRTAPTLWRRSYRPRMSAAPQLPS